MGPGLKGSQRGKPKNCQFVDFRWRQTKHKLKDRQRVGTVFHQESETFLSLGAPFWVEELVISNHRSVSFSPPDRKGLLDFMLESAFAMLPHHAPTQYPARAARQWIPPSIPPEQLASGSSRVSRQSSPSVDPAEYPRVARQWMDPAEYPTRAARSLMSKRADGNLESKFRGCGGICCNGRKLVSMEGIARSEVF